MIRRVISKLRFLPFIMLFAISVGVVALYFQPPGLKLVMRILQLEPGGGTSNPIAVPANLQPESIPRENTIRKIIGLGKLLPKGDIRTVATPFGAGDARIATLFVEEGDEVNKGQQLASLDNQETILAAIENAKASVAARQASLAQIRNSVRASQQETAASLKRATSALENAQVEFERASSLFDRGYTTRSTLDQKRSIRDQAQGEADRLTATRARFAAGSIDEQSDVVVAARNVDAALSELRRAESDLSKARVAAPISGTILDIFVRPGERPSQQGILKIGNISNMTAEVEIYQTEIAEVRLAAPVEMTADALATPLRGTVSKIGLEVGTQTLVDSSPAANTDARVVKVTIKLDDASSKAARRFTNLQVLARIGVPKE
jgi:HlyD family secretion protein